MASQEAASVRPGRSRHSSFVVPRNLYRFLGCVVNPRGLRGGVHASLKRRGRRGLLLALLVGGFGGSYLCVKKIEGVRLRLCTGCQAAVIACLRRGVGGRPCWVIARVFGGSVRRLRDPTVAVPGAYSLRVCVLAEIVVWDVERRGAVRAVGTGKDG